LRAAFRASKGRVERAKLEAATVTLSIARQLCPVSDNNELGHTHMRDTIKLLLGEYGGVRVVVGAPYGPLVNFGTVNMDANPFFTVAVEAGREHMRRVLQSGK
jgi:HK97 gp10 family phage protein